MKRIELFLCDEQLKINKKNNTYKNKQLYQQVVIKNIYQVNFPSN